MFYIIMHRKVLRTNPENSGFFYFSRERGKKVNWNCFRTSSNVWSRMRNKMQAIVHTLRRDKKEEKKHFKSAINAFSSSTLHTLFSVLSLFPYIHSFIHPSIVFALREIDSRVTKVHMVAA